MSVGSVNIAIDGPAGAGKSTIAKRLAKKLGFIYVDTGAMYRAMAYYFLQNGIEPTNEDIVAKNCALAQIAIAYEEGEQQVLLNGTNVSALIRTEQVGNMASVLSAYPAVREKLKDEQRRLAEEANVVMDGRDIGTCILPHAQVKIYLTASSAARAKRRYEELAAKGEACDLERIEQDIIDRDYRDMHRAEAPLKQAEDAVLVDSSEMGIEEVLETIYRIYKEKMAQ